MIAMPMPMVDPLRSPSYRFRSVAGTWTTSARPNLPLDWYAACKRIPASPAVVTGLVLGKSIFESLGQRFH
jgi:hypothetical protein